MKGLTLDAGALIALERGDERVARVAGLLLGERGGSDAVDASVVVCAREYRQAVVTGDPADLRRLDPKLALVAI